MTIHHGKKGIPPKTNMDTQNSHIWKEILRYTLKNHLFGIHVRFRWCKKVTPPKKTTPKDCGDSSPMYCWFIMAPATTIRHLNWEWLANQQSFHHQVYRTYRYKNLMKKTEETISKSKSLYRPSVLTLVTGWFCKKIASLPPLFSSKGASRAWIIGVEITWPILRDFFQPNKGACEIEPRKTTLITFDWILVG